MARAGGWHAVKTLTISVIYGDSSTGSAGETRWGKIDGKKEIKITCAEIPLAEAVYQLSQALAKMQGEIDAAQ